MERKGNAMLIAVMVLVLAVVGLAGYLVWQYFRTPSAPTTATTSLVLTKADCGNWEYLNANGASQPTPTWIKKESCVTALQANDGITFQIKQGATGQSAAQLFFTLPENIDKSKVVSLTGQIIGTCQRNFEIYTLTQYNQWKPISNLQCPPGYLNDTTSTFTPDIHNGNVGVQIVSGDNFNDLIMDQVSVTATYALATSTAR